MIHLGWVGYGVECHFKINVREYRREQSRETGNIEGKQDGDKQLKKNTTQYVLDTTI